MGEDDATSQPTPRHLLVLAGLVVVAVAGYFYIASNDVGVPDPETRPGDSSVYVRIESAPPCSRAQGEFDTAMDTAASRAPGDSGRDVAMSYAEAAMDRLGQLGCP